MQPQIHRPLDAIAVIEPIPPVRQRDWGLAALLALVATAFVVVEDQLPLWAEIVPAVVAVGCIPFRRRVPLTAVTMVTAVWVVAVWVALGGSVVDDLGATAGLADLVLFYALCRWSTPQRIGIGFVVLIIGEVIITSATGGVQSTIWLEILLWCVVAAFALAMRYRAWAIAGQHEQVRLAERHSLARELHDTVAHHVSAIAVQAQAGQYVVDSNPAAAAEALRSIEAIANDSIDEMRRMVGILRSEDDRTRAVAPDTLDVLEAGEGRPTVHVSGDTRLDILPAEVGAALFRVAQESITNARQHSRGVTFVDVSVEHRQDHVRMTVDNDGTPTTRNSGSGYGQIGMQERVEALGGVFESSARPARGWRTSTSIPVTGFPVTGDDR